MTHLKYAVEVQIPRGTPMLGLLEPLLERVVFEDVPCNLAALKQRVETLCLSRRIDRLESAGAHRMRGCHMESRPGQVCQQLALGARCVAHADNGAQCNVVYRCFAMHRAGQHYLISDVHHWCPSTASRPAYRCPSTASRTAKVTISCAWAGEVDRAALLRRSERAERPRLTDMARDFGLLAAELERVYGEQRLLPSRAQLRAAQRGDLDKARASPCRAITQFSRQCACGRKWARCGHALAKLLWCDGAQVGSIQAILFSSMRRTGAVENQPCAVAISMRHINLSSASYWHLQAW